MDWVKLHSYSRKRQTQKNVRCASPLPGQTASVAGSRKNSQAKGLQLHANLQSSDSQVKRTVGEKKGKLKNAVTKLLPKVQECSEVTQMDCLSAEQSIDYRSTEVNDEISNMEIISLKDSLHLNSASKLTQKNSDTTSGITLPTGVSGFLLDCLDMDTTLDSSYTKTSDDTSSYSSPEIFRDETDLGNTANPDRHHECKNSTLLDISKAINIDKMPQLPNLSKILEMAPGGQGLSINRNRQSRQKLHSELTNPSTVVAGKHMYKILPANDNKAKSQHSGASLLLPKQKKQAEDQQPININKKKGGKKIKLKNVSSSSCSHVLSSSGKSNSDESCRIAASRSPDADVLDLSVHESSGSDDFLACGSSPYMNSKEIVPLSPKKTICQYLYNPPEICSIIKASPGFRPVRVLHHPTNRKTFFPPPEATEDIITSSKNDLS